MHLDDIFDNTYPYATFHDATINKIELDYKNKKAIFDMQVFVGDAESKKEEIREEQHAGQLFLHGLYYCVIELPDASYPYKNPDGPWVDDVPIERANKKLKKKLLSNLPENAFVHGFFVVDWNASIFFAAERAVFKWLK